MGEVSFLLQRFLVVHVFHLPSYMHYIPAGIVERKKERKKERIKVNFPLNMQFPFSGVFFQLLILSNWGLSAGTGKLCIFGHLGLVFIWSCFVSCLLLLLYYVICAPVLTEGTLILWGRWSSTGKSRK